MLILVFLILETVWLHSPRCDVDPADLDFDTMPLVALSEKPQVGPRARDFAAFLIVLVISRRNSKEWYKSPMLSEISVGQIMNILSRCVLRCYINLVIKRLCKLLMFNICWERMGIHTFVLTFLFTNLNELSLSFPIYMQFIWYEHQPAPRVDRLRYW